MSIHLFKSVSKLVTGNGASDELIHHIRRLKMSKVLILTDNGVLKSIAMEKLLKNLINSGIEYKIYKDITPEPEIEIVLKTKKFLKVINIMALSL